MFSSDLKVWSIFNFVEEEFISNIRTAYVFAVNRAIIVTKDGNVYILGAHSYPYLRTGHTRDIIRPLLIKELCGKNIKTFISRNDLHVLALTEKGKVFLWDIDADKRSQDDMVHVSIVINDVPSTVVQIACGLNHFIALTNYGKVYTWERGRIFFNSYVMNRKNPMKLYEATCFNKKNVVGISCGAFHSAIVTENGEVYSWGENDFGQLGIGDSEFEEDPCKAMIPAAVVIKKVVCGYKHTLALSDEGSLYVWGNNEHRQLGLRKTNSIYTPTKLEVEEMGKLIDIAATIHNAMSIAMDEHGRIFMWGEIRNGTIKSPMLSPEDCMHKTFAYFAGIPVMHQPLHLYDNEENLTDSLNKAFDDPATSDLVIKVHGKPIYVHKAVLKIRSAHFREILPKNGAQDNISVIQHDQFPYETYRSYLKYLYTDKINLPMKTLLELIDLANNYSEKQLKRQCVQLLKSNITVENFVVTYKAAIEHIAEEIEECCFNFALKHMTAIVQSPDFAELESTVVKAFIIKAAQAGVFKT